MAEEKRKRGRPRIEHHKERNVTFRMMPEDYERLKQYSLNCGVPVTKTINKAIEEYLQSNSK